MPLTKEQLIIIQTHLLENIKLVCPICGNVSMDINSELAVFPFVRTGNVPASQGLVCVQLICKKCYRIESFSAHRFPGLLKK